MAFNFQIGKCINDVIQNWLLNPIFSTDQFFSGVTKVLHRFFISPLDLEVFSLEVNEMSAILDTVFLSRSLTVVLVTSHVNRD